MAVSEIIISFLIGFLIGCFMTFKFIKYIIKKLQQDKEISIKVLK